VRICATLRLLPWIPGMGCFVGAELTKHAAWSTFLLGFCLAV
jgi:hypothetical protein